MSKRIALFIDGTSNKFQGYDTGEWDGLDATNTNVKRLHSVATNDRNQSQITHYIRGVGSIFKYEFFAQLTGFGTAKRIREAYKFLSENYEKGDSVYLFGFSRGAFAARSLAGFVDKVGILYKNRLHLVDQAYQFYVMSGRVPWELLEKHWELFKECRREMDLNEEGNNMPIHFMGLWDTVGAIAAPFNETEVVKLFNSHHKTDVPSYIHNVRHALSLHDLRVKFEPMLFEKFNVSKQTLQQMWFAGVHSDVGGGYDRRQDENKNRRIHKSFDLSAYPLNWMWAEAKLYHLSFCKDATDRDSKEVEKMDINNSLKGVHALAKANVRDALLNWKKYVNAGLTVHDTVSLRLLDSTSRNYGWCSHDIAEKYRQVDETALQLVHGLRFPNSTSPTMLTLRDAELAWTKIRHFLDATETPTSIELTSFYRAIEIWLACVGFEKFDQFVVNLASSQVSSERLELIISGLAQSIPTNGSIIATQIQSGIDILKSKLTRRQEAHREENLKRLKTIPPAKTVIRKK